MPLGCEDVQQSCVGFTSTGGSFYYQYAGNYPWGTNTGQMMKYTAATDTWAIGNAPRFRTAAPRGSIRVNSHVRCAG